MPEGKKQVLIVDDSRDDIRILMENLKKEFAIMAATNGETALELSDSDNPPDVILLDVNMPNMDGYEVCRELKQRETTQEIDVIFVSANDTLDEKLKGYEAGACDYLIKPIDTVELLQKVRLSVAQQEKREQSAQSEKMAMETAMTAIMDAGEQAIVLSFMRQCMETKSFEELAELVVSSTENYDLLNGVYIRNPWESVLRCSHEPMPPLEKELLCKLNNSCRILQRGPRLILNFDCISQFIRNMPEDEDKAGRLRDHLALILEGANSRCKALIMEREVNDALEHSKQALRQGYQQQSIHKERYIKIMDDIVSQIDQVFMSYGLTEEQEEALINVVQNGVNKAIDNFEKGLKLDTQLQQIINRLEIISSSYCQSVS